MQLQETSGVHHLQPRNSSKDSQNTEKSLHVRAKDENPKPIFVTFGFSGCSAIRILDVGSSGKILIVAASMTGLKLDHVMSRSHNSNIKSHHPLPSSERNVLT